MSQQAFLLVEIYKLNLIFIWKRKKQKQKKNRNKIKEQC